MFANTPKPPYYAVIFTNTLSDNQDGYQEMAEKMLTLAAEQDGFLGVEGARQDIGKTPIKPKHRLTCHCGGVELHIDLPDGLVAIRRCNCSLCARRGAAVASVPLPHLHVVKSDTLQLYQFNTRVAEHYFCNRCGIYTHHRRRSNPNEYGINIACLEGVNMADIGDIPWVDGLNNHPKDH